MKIVKSKKIVIQTEGWLKKRFGDCVAQISNESTLRLKSSIKDVFRALHGQVPKHIEALCKELPVPPQGVTDKDFVFGYDANGEWIPGLIETNKKLFDFSNTYPKEWSIIKELMGLVRQKGRHASAYVICDEPVHNFIPLTTVGGVKVTQFSHQAVEAMGGLKMDFLNILILKDLQEAIRLIQDTYAPQIDWSKSRKYSDDPPSMIIQGKRVPYIRAVPFDNEFFDIYKLPDDPNVFNSICESNTDSVFQFNTDSAKGWLSHFNFYKPNSNKKALNSIEELSAFTALDRPGPLDAFVTNQNGQKHNMLVEFAVRARGGEKTGGNPFLDEQLRETYGIIVYQEQLERMYKTIGNTSASEAEAFRRAVAKKDVKKVLKFKEKFMKGAVTSIGQDLAEELWATFETFGQYGFNKSHSICYVIIGYACAFLKYHYPIEWWCAVLRNAKDRSEIDEKFWPVCGHLIDLPDVATSFDKFTIVNKRIKAPLDLLHGIGPKAHKQISKWAPYLDLNDFCKKIQAHKEKGSVLVETVTKDKNGLLKKVVKKKAGPNALNTRVINTLIVSGAMDSLYTDPKKPIVDKILEFQDCLEKNGGKKITEKARLGLIENFKNLTVLEQFQVRKKLLPALDEPILPILLESKPNDFVAHGNDVLHIPSKTLVFGKPLIKAMQNLDRLKLAPMGGIQGGVVAYIVSERRFTYGDGIKKTAVELVCDVEGERLRFVQWPNQKNQLPKLFTDNLDITSSIVILTLDKKQNEPIKMRNVSVVELGLKESKEESPEKETS